MAVQSPLLATLHLATHHNYDVTSLVREPDSHWWQLALSILALPLLFSHHVLSVGILSVLVSDIGSLTVLYSLLCIIVLPGNMQQHSFQA